MLVNRISISLTFSFCLLGFIWGFINRVSLLDLLDSYGQMTREQHLAEVEIWNSREAFIDDQMASFSKYLSYSFNSK